MTDSSLCEPLGRSLIRQRMTSIFKKPRVGEYPRTSPPISQAADETIKRTTAMNNKEMKQQTQTTKRIYEKPILIHLNCTSETYGKDRDQFEGTVPPFLSANGPS
jgi:hypothetical protein